jgi:hypothetical protein
VKKAKGGIFHSMEQNTMIISVVLLESLQWLTLPLVNLLSVLLYILFISNYISLHGVLIGVAGDCSGEAELTER